MNLIEKIEDRILKQQLPIKRDTNWASDLAHPCLRYLVHCRLDWLKRQPLSLSKILMFEEGKHQELKVLQDMRDAGLKVIREQEQLEWERYQISGRVDAFIKIGKKETPLEIKSVSPYSFGSINTERDLYNGKFWWYRNWLGQMNLYLAMAKVNKGFVIIKNKSSGKLKQIGCELVEEFIDTLIKKASLINQHTKSGTYPPPIEFREDVCNECGFRHLCQSIEKLKQRAEQLDIPRLAELLDRRQELKSSIQEFKTINEEIKEMPIPKNREIRCGNWLIRYTKQKKKKV